MKIKPEILVTFEMKAPTFWSNSSYIRAVELGTGKVLLQKEYTRKGPAVYIRSWANTRLLKSYSEIET